MDQRPPVVLRGKRETPAVIGNALVVMLLYLQVLSTRSSRPCWSICSVRSGRTRTAWLGSVSASGRNVRSPLPCAIQISSRNCWCASRAAGSRNLSLKSKGPGPKPRVEGSLSEPSTLNPQPSTSVLLVHGEHDEVFPLSQAKRVAACLRTNGVPVELRVLPGEDHGFGANRLLVFRVIGEQCLMRLKGPDALANYRSILSWQAQAKPLWLFWTPAFLWAAICLWLRRKVGQASRLPPEANAVGQPSRLPPEAPLAPQDAGTQKRSGAEGELKWGSRGRSRSRGAGGTPALLWWEIGLRWLAAGLAIAALAQTALHLVPPRLPIGERTLAIARKHLVAPKERSDFELLAAKPCWSGKRLKTLLEHVELANYNRELINWKLDEQMLFWLPGELTCPQNLPTLRLANSPALKDWTEEILQRAHKLEPLNI